MIDQKKQVIEQNKLEMKQNERNLIEFNKNKISTSIVFNLKKFKKFNLI